MIPATWRGLFVGKNRVKLAFIKKKYLSLQLV